MYHGQSIADALLVMSLVPEMGAQSIPGDNLDFIMKA